MKPHILRFALLALTTGMMTGSALAAPEAVPARAPATPSLSSPQLLLQMFLAEVALARGLLADADALYGEVLKRSDDARIVRRGNDIALAKPDILLVAITSPKKEQFLARWSDRIQVPIYPIAGRLWARLSAQVYNELSDYEALARVFGR